MTYSIAEIGLNHNGDYSHAKLLMLAAKEAGFSAVKFQNFKASDVYVSGERSGTYHLMGQEISIYELHERLEMQASFFRDCRAYASQLGIDFMSSPIGLESLKLLVDLNPAAIKISSYEITNLPFLEACAETNLPLVMSTGGCSVREVAEAIDLVSSYHDDFQILHCVVQYPTQFSNANLKCILSMREIFGVPVGFSNNGFIDGEGRIDYAQIPYCCGLLGCSSYEVHITLDRQGEGVDQGFSIEPNEQRKTIIALKEGNEKRFSDFESIDEEILGSGVKRSAIDENYVRSFAFKKLFYIRDMSVGTVLSASDFRALRPGEFQVKDGLDPKFNRIVEGLSLTKAVRAMDPVRLSDFKNGR